MVNLPEEDHLVDSRKMQAEKYVAVAEEMFKMSNQRNLKQAQDFVLMAKNEFPSLVGLDGILTAYNIHLTAISANIYNDKMINWYRVLCVCENASPETIKSRYKQLAVLIHPDKNRSVAAEGAFKLVKEATDILLDENRRKIYDESMRKRSGEEETITTATPEKRKRNKESMRKRRWEEESVSESDSPPPSWARSYASSEHPRPRAAPFSGPSSYIFSTECSLCSEFQIFERKYFKGHANCRRCGKGIALADAKVFLRRPAYVFGDWSGKY